MDICARVYRKERACKKLGQVSRGSKGVQELFIGETEVSFECSWAPLSSLHFTPGTQDDSAEMGRDGSSTKTQEVVPRESSEPTGKDPETSNKLKAGRAGEGESGSQGSQTDTGDTFPYT